MPETPPAAGVACASARGSDHRDPSVCSLGRLAGGRRGRPVSRKHGRPRRSPGGSSLQGSLFPARRFPTHTAWLGPLSNRIGAGVARGIGLNSNHIFSWRLQRGSRQWRPLNTDDVWPRTLEDHLLLFSRLNHLFLARFSEIELINWQNPELE